MSGEWAIVADLPLGVYRGRTADGDVDPLPAPARLHGALLNAAAQGPRAEVVAGDLRPTSRDLDALQWLERNPPTGVVVPRTRRTAARNTVYRDEGVIRKEGKMPAPGPKKVGKAFTGVIAVQEAFAWTWEVDPPAEVQEVLTALVGDVGHLGTSETPARLWVERREPTHRLARDASVFDAPRAEGSTADLDVADEGRTRYLVETYAKELRPPKPAEDRWASSELPRSRTGWNDHRRTARYVRPDAGEPSDSPWSTVLLARLRTTVRDRDRLALSVSVHRQLIRRIGEGAPTVLTGAYPPEAEKPANRVAIQILPASAAPAAGLEPVDHLALLLPRHGHPVDLAVVTQAFGALRAVRGNPLEHVPPRDASRFWPEQVTTWSVAPAGVPDSRPVNASWSLHDVVRLSTALAFRQVWKIDTVGGSRAQFYVDLAARSAEKGVRVLEGEFLRVSDVTPYVHKAPERGVVRPYSAVVDLGDIDSQALLAIGQSRHLGGGLLVPAQDGVSP